MNLKPSVLLLWLFPLAFQNVRLLLYVFSLDVCKSKRFQITSDTHRFAKIKAIVFCLAINGTLRDFSDHLFCVIFVFFVLHFVVTFWNYPIAKTLQLKLEKDSRQLYFDLSSTRRAWWTQKMYMYLHTLCSKDKHTFYTSKDNRLHNNNFLA